MFGFFEEPSAYYFSNAKVSFQASISSSVSAIGSTFTLASNINKVYSSVTNVMDHVGKGVKNLYFAKGAQPFFSKVEPTFVELVINETYGIVFRHPSKIVSATVAAGCALAHKNIVDAFEDSVNIVTGISNTGLNLVYGTALLIAGVIVKGCETVTSITSTNSCISILGNSDSESHGSWIEMQEIVKETGYTKIDPKDIVPEYSAKCNQVVLEALNKYYGHIDPVEDSDNISWSNTANESIAEGWCEFNIIGATAA